ncbi:MAG: peptidylprolyl isomerase [Bacteroidia bacterium]|nr:peptidylprolyl isomerase [Bacteroidia bacterium]
MAGILLLLLSCQSAPQAGQESQMAAADVVLVTDRGEIGLKLYDETPQHKANFLKLAAEGFYDSLTFHRVIAGFMIQSGDPRTRVAAGVPLDAKAPDGPGYDLPAEIVPGMYHTRGKLAAARYGDAENPERKSSGSQFYIVSGRPARSRQLDSLELIRSGTLRGKFFEAYQPLAGEGKFQGSFDDYLAQEGFEGFAYPDEVRDAYLTEGGAPWLDFEYTIFGEVIAGMDVVMNIEKMPRDAYDRPVVEVRILQTRVKQPQ